MTYHPIIGLMSGTSLDGIDATLIFTNGKNVTRSNFNSVTPYSKETKFLLNEAIDDPLKFLRDQNKFNYLSNLVTKDHAIAAKEIIFKSKISPFLIGFHGQTIFHAPQNNYSVQLGSGKQLSKLLKVDVVYNFRSNDIKKGGQGAPIAPIYHKSIIENLDLNLPVVAINIGGISNLSYLDDTILIGFDTGPGNNFMDFLMQSKFSLQYDKDGIIARSGTPNFELIYSFLDQEYFYKKPPKSLERKFLFENDVYSKIISLNPKDAMSTFCHLTALSIKKSYELLPQNPKYSILVGGGQNNIFLVSLLKKYLPSITLSANETKIPGDFIEAELIAFLAARRYYHLPITFPSTTGVRKDMVGGTLIKFKSLT